MSNVNFNDPEMQEIFEGFLVETKEILDNLSRDLLQLESNTDEDTLNRIFRGFHTIKGTSSFMGFDEISDVTHHTEDLLNKLRKFEIKVTPEIIDVLLEMRDEIEKMVEMAESGSEINIDQKALVSKLSPWLESVAGDNSNDSVAQEKYPGEPGSSVEKVLSNRELFEKEGDFTEEELEMLDKAFAEVNESFSKDKGKDKAGSPSSKTEEKKLHQNIKIGHSSETIRLDVGRIENLMDISGELVLGRNRLAQLISEIEKDSGKDKLRELIDTSARIDFITSEIQSAVMRMRMVPIGKLYQKAPRIVRELSREFGKNIKLVIKGEETEIDRGIIEELNDPLVHMIRNSCDHGIESPEQRENAGKPPEGTITLDAEQEGNNIVLRISDDGAGIDTEKILKKAIEKGIIDEAQSVQMSEQDIYQLLFAPGFSTAKQVSNVSGRGVGMDVVRTNIQKLKGMIDVESELGTGTTIVIKLPLTLAIIQGLLVKCGEETYAIPLNSVIEVVAIDEEQLTTINKREVIKIRDELLPLVRLGEVLDSPGSNHGLHGKYVVNAGYGNRKTGIVVDHLIGQQEIVIKSLGDYLGSVKGIAGCTIMGDGKVIMIVDIGSMIQGIFSNKYFAYSN